MIYFRWFLLGLAAANSCVTAAPTNSAPTLHKQPADKVTVPTKTVARSAPAVPDCQGILEAVEEGVKSLSYLSAADSSRRGEVGTRATQRVGEITAIQANLMLLQAHHCSMPLNAITDSAYIKDAERCVSAMEPKELFSKESKDARLCNRSTWTRNK